MCTSKNDRGCLVLRFAHQSDVVPMANLLAELFSIETDFKIDLNKHITALTELLASPECAVIFVVEVHNVIVGMITGQIIISTAMGGKSILLEDFIIKQAYRGQGIGHALLIKIEDWAKSKKILRIQLSADMRNIDAIKYYLKHQYIQSNMVGLYKLNL